MNTNSQVKIKPSVIYLDKALKKETEGILIKQGQYFSTVLVNDGLEGTELSVLTKDIKQ